MSNDNDSDISNLFSFYMQNSYWDIDTYEDEDEDDFRVVVNMYGIPYYINNDINVPLKGIFILDTENVIHMTTHRYMSHSDFLSGMPVLCAGEYKSHDDGRIKYINNRSGHYIPHGACLFDVEDVIRENGYNGRIIKLIL
jgi:hypothetical protein